MRAISLRRPRGSDPADHLRWLLWNTVPSGDCRLWTGGVVHNAKGNKYGKAWWMGATVLVHRLSCYLAHGPIPRGKVVMHQCHTTLCCAPWHLKPGTQSQNIAVAWSRARRPTTLTE